MKIGRIAGPALACALLLVLLPSSAAAAAGEFRGGVLRARVDGASAVDLPLRSTELRAEVAGGLAEIVVRQVFVAPPGERIEGRWFFPRPAGAELVSSRVERRERVIRGAVRPQGEGCPSLGETPPVLVFERPDLFELPVPAVAPDREVLVEVRWRQRVAFADGRYRLALPWPAAVGEVFVAADIVSGRPVLDVSSPTHPIRVATAEDGSVAATVASAPRDLVLEWTVAGAEPEVSSLRHLVDDVTIHCLRIEPPAGFSTEDVVPRDLVFLVDGSLAGAERALADRTVGACVDTMRPADTSRRRAFGREEELRAALAEELGAGSLPGRLRIVLLLADGCDVDREALLRIVRDAKGAGRLFPVGIGEQVDRELLEDLALLGRGDFRYVVGDPAEADAVAARIATPLLTDVAADGHGADALSLAARRIPDLFADQPVELVVDPSGLEPGSIVLTGRRTAGAWRRVIRFGAAAPDPRTRILEALRGPPDDRPRAFVTEPDRAVVVQLPERPRQYERPTLDGPPEPFRFGGEIRVDLGLEWLARHQDPDGGWRAAGFADRCWLSPCDGAGDARLAPAVTSLALLAFLGAGETPKHGAYCERVTEGFRYLERIETPEGGFGDGLAHAAPTLAVCHLYTLTGAAEYRGPAGRALAHLFARPEEFFGDAAAAPFAAAAVKSARDGGLAIDPDALAAASAAARAADLDPATALFVRLCLGEDVSAEECPDPPPDLAAADATSVWLRSVLRFQIGGAAWRRWSPLLGAGLFDAARPGGDARGSFDPPAGTGRSLGRVGETALRLLVLELHFRYARVFGAR